MTTTSAPPRARPRVPLVSVLVGICAVACADPEPSFHGGSGERHAPAEAASAPRPPSPAATEPPAPAPSAPPAVPTTEDPRTSYAHAAALFAADPSPASWPAARPWLERACTGGVAEACTGLAATYGPEGDLPDEARAAPLLSRACELGDAWGCTNYGTRLAGGRGVPADPVAALAAYRRGCDLGDGVGCSNAASSLWNGRAGPPDPEGAVAMAERGCALGDAMSCAAAAAPY